ncbi:hypothetical protein TcarDRAFT_2135 [Thermosinus carboxydivorans Nor1]|uniref:Magnesium transporter MgtE intracellular domain-containing protein n=1 Tax=Thermosinus carboxydivorans Nor1 TaxID=401526 RepID=A1HN36_9FIRM|nr:hypothetical protein [Thermosinus carboxydivorans]EAX48663.1 hypothetical protein TcarDRAFT_2135 [Thermosinus carboxydivorans Nor1]
MAGKIKDNVAATPPKTAWGGFFKLLLALLLMLMLAGGAFWLGVYLNFIDLDKLADDWKLYDKPVIGRFFSKPQPVLPPAEDTEASAALPVQSAPLTPPVKAPIETNPSAATEEVTEKSVKGRQMEEAKRASKLARLYTNMKPEEAANILNQLDDSIVLAILNKMEEDQAAKILATFDAGRAARLTEAMLKKKQDM